MNKNDLIFLASQLDIDESVKSEILDSIQNGQTEAAMRVLKKYRSTVLDKLHSGQDKLYQIDFVLQKTREEKL